MLSRVYSIFDRRHRPLRNHVYLAFPKHDVAYARITEPAFRTLCPYLHCLAGNTPDCDVNGSGAEFSERLLFHGDVELLTARELKRRYPDMKILAWVQDPRHRLAYCYEKVIASDDPLPSYYDERQFSKEMSPVEFVSQISYISDLEADNLFRSQAAALTYKGMLTADIVLPLERFEGSMETFLKESSLDHQDASLPSYRISDFVSDGTLRSFEGDELADALRWRYKSDYELFYENEYGLSECVSRHRA